MPRKIPWVRSPNGITAVADIYVPSPHGNHRTAYEAVLHKKLEDSTDTPWKVAVRLKGNNPNTWEQQCATPEEAHQALNRWLDSKEAEAARNSELRERKQDKLKSARDEAQAELNAFLNAL